MTDTEINRALALSIGWPIVWRSRDGKVWVGSDILLIGKVFDYRDWKVIGPIAARYNMFPFAVAGWWNVAGYGQPSSKTPQKAIALAVIKRAKE